jgi:hypothetical protein
MLNLKPAGNIAGDFLDEVARRHGHITSERMNDQSTHAEMLAAFDEAIVAARQRTGVALQTSITCTSHSS